MRGLRDRAVPARTRATRAGCKVAEIKDKVLAELVSEDGPLSDLNVIKNEFFNLEAKIVRNKILDGEPRIDGRDTRTVRPIEIRTGVLPRAHGSALFTRGETQALVVTTLGTGACLCKRRDLSDDCAASTNCRCRHQRRTAKPPCRADQIGDASSRHPA